MKTTGHLVIYISEDEDFELWRFLSQLPANEREIFIKSALKASINKTGSETVDSSLLKSDDYYTKYALLKSDNFLSDLTKSKLEYNKLAVHEKKVSKSFLENHTDENTSKLSGYKDISEQNESDNNLESVRLENLIQSGENIQNAPMRGLDFLLNNVIGEENDENVINYFRNNK